MGKGRIHLVGAKRKFDTVQSMFPFWILGGIVLPCGRAISIVAPHSPKTWMDIRIWAWLFMTVIAICRAIVYYWWVVAEKKTTIFWGNAMLQLELDLKNCKS